MFSTVARLIRPSFARTLVLINLVGFAAIAQAQIAFQDVTSTAGPFHTGESFGAAWGDFNGDARPDLHVNNHRHRDSIYRNDGDGTFSDVTLQVDTSGTWLGPTGGGDTHGGSWADFDGDEDQDLLVSNGPGPAYFFVNEDGVFVEQAAQYLLTGDGRGRMPSWLDFNDDGQTDVLMARLDGAPRVWQQLTSTFANRTVPAGMTCNANQYTQLSDLNNDGRVDILCAKNTGLFPDRVFDTSTFPFTNITTILPSTNTVADTATGDFDGNQRPDLFLVRGSLGLTEALRISPSRIEAYFAGGGGDQGEGAGGSDKGFTFTGSGSITIDVSNTQLTLNKISIGSGRIHPAAEPFTLDPLDPSTQGIAAHNPAVEQGLFVGLVDPGTQQWEVRLSSGPTATLGGLVVTGTSLSVPTALGLPLADLPIAPRLLMNLATGFQDQTAASGLNTNLSCASAAAADFDNDRDLDLFLVCRGGVQNLPDRLYENQGNGVFVEVPGAGGAQGIVGAGIQSGAGTGESVAVADYDLDGFIDLFVTNGMNIEPVRVGGPDQLFRNVGNTNHWVELQLRGTVSNPDAIGATVLASSGGVTQLREQNGGYHRWSQHHSYVHFGLAESSTVDLEVRWPSGQVDEFSGVAADELYRVTEGTSSGTGTIEPVVLGPVPPLPPLQPGDECGTPLYNSGIDKKIFLWKNCTSGVWSLRATAGGSPVTVRYEGELNSDQPFSGVTPFSLEGGDILNNTDPTLILYRLNMSTSSQDGFDFQFPAGANVCLSVTMMPPGAQVLVGPLRKIASLPLCN